MSDSIPALSITWQEITAVVTILFTMTGFIWNNNYRFNKKVDKGELEKYKEEMGKQLEKVCIDNTASHAIIMEQSERDFNLVRDEMKIERENVASKIDLLLTIVEKIEKNGKKR